MADIEKNETPMASIDTSQPIIPGGRDESLDIMSLLKSEDTAKPTAKADPPKKSALQQAKERKEGEQKGLIVNTEELIARNTQKPVGNKTEVDAIDEVDKYAQEQDAMIEAAKKVVVKEAPKTALEMAALMDNLENVAKTGSVESDESQDANPESFMQTRAGNIDNLRLKTDEELEATPDKAIVEGQPEEEAPAEKSEEDKEKERIATVLIDKTGFGGDWAFTEEEREKLFVSTEIRLKEVEDVNLATLTVRKADKSFVEEAQEYQFSSSQTTMTFPASRFKADMVGLTYGEMGDIAVNNENVTFEQIRKKLTVIYNKMRNPSCGKFESFDDFLKKFAYVDLDLAVFGLVIATFPEVDDIPLNCQNPKCKKSFNHRFSPRTLLDWKKCNIKLLKDIDLVAHASAEELPNLIINSPAQNFKVIKLPLSGFVIKLGIASAYDYLYTIVDNVIGSKFEEEHPDDVNGILQLNSMLLSLIRAVLIPQPDGSYIEYDKFEDMINALYSIKPEEIKILTSILQKYNNVYNVPFELRDIVCPHCGTVTKTLAIDINYLVFMKYQRLMSEELDVDNIILL